MVANAVPNEVMASGVTVVWPDAGRSTRAREVLAAGGSTRAREALAASASNAACEGLGAGRSTGAGGVFTLGVSTRAAVALVAGGSTTRRCGSTNTGAGARIRAGAAMVSGALWVFIGPMAAVGS